MPVDDTPSPRRGSDVRKKIAVGAVGAAAVLGVGAYAITAHLTAQESTTAGDAGAPAPVATASASPVASAAVPASPSETVTSSGTAAAAPSATTMSPQVKKQIDQARAAGAKAGHPLVRALTAENALPESAVHTRTEQTADGTVRITTARGDLTGQGDLLLPADDGRRVGDARCTQKLHFSNAEAPRTIPMVMICWRTSATRSVATMTVAQKKAPSAAAGASIIDREWAKLS